MAKPPKKGRDTVDGRTPAPSDMVNILLFAGSFLHPRWLFGSSEPSTVLNKFRDEANLGVQTAFPCFLSSSHGWNLLGHRKKYIPGTQMTSIIEGQPHKTRPKSQSKQGSFGCQVYKLHRGYFIHNCWYPNKNSNCLISLTKCFEFTMYFWDD